MHNEHLDFYEIVEKVDEVYTKMLPGFICKNCGTKYLFITSDENDDLVVSTPLNPEDRLTSNCNLHLNFDLLVNPLIGERVMIPKGYETLTGQKVFLPEKSFARLWLGNRMN